MSAAITEVVGANHGDSIYYDSCSSEEVSLLNEAFNIIQDQVNVAQVCYLVDSFSFHRWWQHNNKKPLLPMNMFWISTKIGTPLCEYNSFL